MKIWRRNLLFLVFFPFNTLRVDVVESINLYRIIVRSSTLCEILKIFSTIYDQQALIIKLTGSSELKGSKKPLSSILFVMVYRQPTLVACVCHARGN